MVTPNEPEEPEPDRIVDMPDSRRRKYDTLTLTYGSTISGVLVYGELTTQIYGTRHELLVAIFTDIFLGYAVGLIASHITLRLGDLAMVLVHYIRERTRKRHDRTLQEGRKQGREEGRKEGREQGREQGFMESNALWEDWNNRRVAAEINQQPFDEPPPSARRPDSES